MFSEDRSPVSILAAGSCPAPGPFWSKILPGIRRPTLSMFSPTAKSAHYPVKDFPILAKLLAERYEPVVHTAEGVIYRMR